MYVSHDFTTYLELMMRINFKAFKTALESIYDADND